MTDTEELTEGTKHDGDKIRLDLVSPEFIYGVADVLTFGANKYEEYNWAKGINYHRLYRAAMGHLHDWWMGEEYDKESHLPHLWHAACCLMFLNHYELHPEYVPFDDRPLKYFKDEM